MMRRAALVAAAVLGFAACGDDDEPGTSAPPTGTQIAPIITDSPITTDSQINTDSPITTAPTSTTTTTTALPPPKCSRDAPASTVDELLAVEIPVNLAHAGGDQSFPHSTMFAFCEGVLAGADALEMDVQLTGDGVLIVQHDDTVDKTTRATGPVADLTLAEIQALDNAYWFSPQCWPCHDRPEDEYVYRGVRTGDVIPPDGYGPDDFRVETFRSIAAAFPDHVFDIEIKGEYPDALPVVEELAAEIEELGRTDGVVVVAFDDQLLDAFHELAPEVALSPGLTRLTEWFLSGVEIEPYFTVFQVPPFQGDIEVVSPETVQRVHDEGRVIWVWADDASAQENADFYRVLLDTDVDGIITGRPAAMVEALAG